MATMKELFPGVDVRCLRGVGHTTIACVLFEDYSGRLFFNKTVALRVTGSRWQR